MGYLRDFLLLICALLLQSTLGPKVEIGGISPNLMVLSVLCGALSKGEVWGTVIGFLGGFLMDLYSPDHLGLNSLSLSVVGFLGGSGKGRVGTEYLLVQVGVCLSAVLLYDGIYMFFLEKGNIARWLYLMATRSVPTAVYTAAVGIGISTLRSVVLGRKLIYVKG